MSFEKILFENNILNFISAMTIDERIETYKKYNIENKDNTNLEDWVNIKGLISKDSFNDILKILNLNESDFNLALKVLTIDEKNTMKEDLFSSSWFQLYKKIMEIYYDNRNNIDDLIVYDLSMSVTPFILYSLNELQKTISTLKNIELSEDIIDIILDKISISLLKLANKILVWELHNSKLNYDITKGDDKFKEFIKNNFIKPNNILNFYSKYPVLARRLTMKCDFITSHFIELLKRFNDDFKDICNELNISHTQNLITDLSCDEGDTHDRGRFVVKIELNGNTYIMYKPRNLKIKENFSKFIKWFNDESNLLDVKVNSAFYRNDYTFEAFVEYSECKSESEVENYYERFGEICAIIHILRGNDIHYENIIASRDYPMIIDIETLFQMQVLRIYNNDDARSLTLAKNIESLPGTGLLPMTNFSNGLDKKGIDLSGINGDAQKLPFKILQITNENSDDMKFEYKDGMMDASNNIPKLNGEKINFKKYIPKIILGFKNAYEFFQSRKSEIIKDPNLYSIFKNTTIRHLIKSTQNYISLMDYSTHPNYNSDMIYLERLLFNAFAYDYSDKRCIKYEIIDMFQDDIPVFFGITDSRHLISSNREVIPDYFSKTPYDKGIERVKELSEKNMKEQISHIKVMLGKYEEENSKKFAKFNSEKYNIVHFDLSHNKEILLKEAMDIGNIIVNEAIWDLKRDTVIWNNVFYDKLNECYKIGPVDYSFYRGLSGILLFFYGLNNITSEEKFNEVYKVIKDNLLKTQIYGNISINEGFISMLSPLSLIYMNNGDMDIYEKIYNLTLYISSNFESIDDQLVTIPKLINLFVHLYNTSLEELFLEVSKELIEKIIPLLNNNYKMDNIYELTILKDSLKEYSNIVNNKDVLRIIQDIHKLENEFAEKIEQKQKLIDYTDTKILATSLNILEDNELNEIFLKKLSILKESDSLQNGNMGDIECIYSYFKNDSKTELLNILNDKISKVLSRKNYFGEYSFNTIDGFTNVGLFTGISGIGYMLLRLYDDEKIPSMLSLY